jgi:hypothetical protein
MWTSAIRHLVQETQLRGNFGLEERNNLSLLLGILYQLDVWCYLEATVHGGSQSIDELFNIVQNSRSNIEFALHGGGYVFESIKCWSLEGSKIRSS